MKKAKATRQKLPTGWTEKEVRELAQYYDSLTEEEQVARQGERGHSTF